MNDPNQLLEMCTRVRSIFVHLINIVNIDVLGSMPSECFKLSSPMDTVKRIELQMFDVSFGFPFDQFKWTDRVIIRSNTPIIAIDSLWTLSQMLILRIKMIAPARFTVNDELASKFISSAERLIQLQLDDCGDKTFDAIVAAEDRLTSAKFTHKSVTIHWKEKQLLLNALPSFNSFGAKYAHLPSRFEKIIVIGRIDLDQPNYRYNAKWSLDNRRNELQFTELGWYIFFKNQNVMEVNLKKLKINDAADSFWFVHNSIGSISNRRCSCAKRNTDLKNYLYVTHDTSDLGNSENKQLINLSISQVKGVLKQTKCFEYMVMRSYNDGKLVKVDKMYLMGYIFGWFL